MGQQPIALVGFLEDRVEPVYKGTELCHVYLVLSATPPAPWVEQFSWWHRNECPIRDALDFDGSVLRLQTSPGTLGTDLEIIEDGLLRTNAAFEREEGQALAAAAAILAGLKARFSHG